MGYGLVGKVWRVETFADYFRSVNTGWAKSITLHHTSSPSLAQRPQGFLKQHIHNIQYFYKVKLGWSRGPHLFIDEDEIFGMSEMHEPGVHARSFNSTSLGIEVLGNYDKEDPKNGRGLKCWTTAAVTVAIMCKKMGIIPTKYTIKFHRDDPKTNKSCPGKLVSKDWFVGMVREVLQEMKTDKDQPIQSVDTKKILERIESIEYQLVEVKKLIS